MRKDDWYPQDGVQDTYVWRLSSGQYTTKSAYKATFQGSIIFGPWERIWNSWAPGECRFFLWLVAHNRCWTADSLVRRNLPHPSLCPLCDQEETINHLLATCVFARQFWFFFLQRVGLGLLAPQPSHKFEDWWCWLSSMANGIQKNGLNSIILGAWSLWRHRNDWVFNGASPSLSKILMMAGDDARLWSMAGAKGFSFLTSQVDGI